MSEQPDFWVENKAAIEGMNCLRQLRKNAENGKFIPAISKYNSARAHWLKAMCSNEHLWTGYFAREWNDLPARLKNEVEGLRVIG